MARRDLRSVRPSSSTSSLSSLPSLACLILAFLCIIPSPAQAIKFELAASRYPIPKCIWNNAHEHALVIVTANVSPGNQQRVDIEVVDGSEHRNVYLNKRGINGETRLAITSHSEGEIGVCFKNTVDASVSNSEASKLSRVVDLDVDIGADAIDYNAIANQESLSALETEMRKLEGIVKEVTDELGYLKRRESRFRDTNESTKDRVQGFALFTIVCLVALGVWQIFHLRSFFRRKYLID
ncbi:vesicle coat component [Tulasnella sp. 427]|nr:vesicle coat component [Tulasnella sp. 427]